MSAENKIIDLTNVSDEELEKALQARNKAAQSKVAKQRRDYENKKEEVIYYCVDKALELQEELARFKTQSYHRLQSLYKEMLALGEGKQTESDRGSFTVKSANGSCKVEYKNYIIKEFDETVALAEEKLREFLTSTVKKKDQTTHKMIMQLLERGSDGKLNPDLMGKLMNMKEEINHPVFSEVVQLFAKSYKETGSKTYMLFKRKDDTGAFKNITLSFPSVPILEHFSD